MPDRFISAVGLATALAALRGTADPSLKVWMTLKAMGLTESQPVDVRATEENSGQQLRELFGYPQAPNPRKYFVPFASTKRFMTMADEAPRSQIQTAVKEWAEGGRQADPRQFLSVSEAQDGAWRVSLQPGYPNGLGRSRNGFAGEDGRVVAVPLRAWASWFGRRTPIPETEPQPMEFLVREMLRRLNISPEEKIVIFRDDPDFSPQLADAPISDAELNQLVTGTIDGATDAIVRTYQQTEAEYARRLGSIRSDITGPRWLNAPPSDLLAALVTAGSKAILLYGPPRTGKTRAIDALFPRTSPDRVTIQIHDGWGYERLMLGLTSDGRGGFTWAEGPLLKAIRQRKRVIVLEEANRTQLAQSLGETFSLLENAYRGAAHSVLLRDGSSFSVDPTTIFFFTLNTLDKSTEEIDDALLGRMAAVEFPARVEDLHGLLSAKGVSEDSRFAIAEFFAAVKEKYPLGHGYFSDLAPGVELGSFYVTRIRPVIQKHFNYRRAELTDIDQLADKLLHGRTA